LKQIDYLECGSTIEKI